MRHIKFTVFNAATGAVVRTGVCPEHLAERFVRKGEGLLRGLRASHLEDMVTGNGLTGFKVERRPEADIAARQAAAQPRNVDPLAVFREALKAKGISLTDADLTAATLTVQARGKALAPAGK